LSLLGIPLYTEEKHTPTPEQEAWLSPCLGHYDIEEVTIDYLRDKMVDENDDPIEPTRFNRDYDVTSMLADIRDKLENTVSETDEKGQFVIAAVSLLIALEKNDLAEVSEIAPAIIEGAETLKKVLA